MYGDNRKIIMGGAGILLFVLFLLLTTLLTIKVNRLEKSLVVQVEEPPSHPQPSVGDRAPKSTDSQTKGNRLEPFYSAITLWQNHEAEQERVRAKTETLLSGDWSFLDDLALDFELTSTSELYRLVWVEEGRHELLFTITPDAESEDSWLLTSVDGQKRTFTKPGSPLRRFIESQSEEQKEKIALSEDWDALFNQIILSKEFKSLLSQKKCTLQREEVGSRLAGVTLLTSEERVVLRGYGQESLLWIDGESVDGDFEQYKTSFLKALKLCDSRPYADIVSERNRDLLLSTVKGGEFRDYLEEKGLEAAPELRSDEDFTYLDLIDGSGVSRAAFGIKKTSGQIYMIDGDDVPLTALDTLGTERDQDDSFLIDGPGGNSFSILLVGHHNKNTDTIILANVDRESEKITLISIPRDLWWEGQKINAYYYGESRDELLSVVSDITGIDVDYYLTIDMYAFIDVVNSLGGIDITLTQEVNDPTYKVIREDGSEGVLYYPPGDYHLNGVEALRLARSRHGSSDFERSLLQQEILESLKTRAEQLSLSDGALVNDFVKIGLNSVETNMSLPFIVKNLVGCRDYAFDSGHGLNSEETTFSTYSNYLYLTDEEMKAAMSNSEFERGQWILLPRNNDWALLQRRVRTILES